MAGEATVEELNELIELLNGNSDLARFASFLNQPNKKENTADMTEAEASYGLHAMKIRLKEEQEEQFPATGATAVQTAKKNRNYGRVAMMVAILGCVFLGLWMFESRSGSKKTQQPKNEVVSRKGSRSSIKLPDGSQVWLNADSKLSYSADFSEGNREVSLIGEAYFDVVKDPRRPFIIHTDKIDIKVLGTAFNVKSYPQDDVIETALIHGKIEITYRDRPTEKVILMPNEKLIIRKDQQTNSASSNSVPKIQLSSLVPIQDSLLPETAWLSDKLVFTNETLANIAEMLERRFDVQVVFMDNEVQHFTYTGIFENEPLEKILELMSLSQKFNYAVEKEKVILRK